MVRQVVLMVRQVVLMVRQFFSALPHGVRACENLPVVRVPNLEQVWLGGGLDGGHGAAGRQLSPTLAR